MLSIRKSADCFRDAEGETQLTVLSKTFSFQLMYLAKADVTFNLNGPTVQVLWTYFCPLELVSVFKFKK